jgi:hypothetical protein
LISSPCSDPFTHYPQSRWKRKEYVKKALEKGWIRPSKSPAGAPVLLVSKKDGGYRLCVDYKGLNAIIIKNAYQIANMEQAINCLSGAKIYTQLDLRDVKFLGLIISTKRIHMEPERI